MYFESMSGDEEVRWLSKGLPNMLITNLAQTPGLDVVSSQRIQRILKQIGQEDLESLDESVVEEVARKAGAGAVVMGSIFKSGEEIRLDVQVQDVDSGRVLAAESVRGEDVFPMVDEITARIRTSLSLGDQPEGRPLAEVTTTSLEAFQLYSEGHEAVLNLRLGDAQEPLERAAEIDPSFAMAYLDLAYLAGRRGEPAAETSYLDKAYQNRERLPERQKLAVEAQFAGIREHDTEKGIDLLETLVSRYPDEESAHVALANAYLNNNRPEESESAARRGLEALPDSGPLYNMHGYALLTLHRYPEAIRAFEAYARVEPEEPNARDSLGEALLITGQAEKALESYARAMEVDPSFQMSRSGRSYAYAMMGRYDDAAVESEQLAKFAGRIGFPLTVGYFMNAFAESRLGRLREAQEYIEEGIKVAEGLGDLQRAAAIELVRAVIAVERVNYPAAFESLGRVDATIPQVTDPTWNHGLIINAALLRGTAQARSGNLDAARAQLEIQREVVDDRDASHVWMHRALEGEIALATGDIEAAENAFLAAEPEVKMWFSLGDTIPTTMANNWPFHDGLARVKKAQGKTTEAIEIYRDLLQPDMGSKWTMWLQPRYVLELARLLDETGDKEGARAEYERFLELWKNADEGLPELKEARAYVGK
jgi:tetratricopeptide (TPR) repeat protein/TolB-like protein